MAKQGDNSNGKRPLVEYLDEIESLEAEKKQTGESIKAVYARAESEGIDSKALKQIVKDRRGDMEKTAQLRERVNRYVKELGKFGETELGQWAAATLAAQTSARNSRAPLIRPKREDEESDQPEPTTH